MKGKVVKLFYTCNDEAKTRVETDSFKIDTEGVIPDKFHAKNLQRSVLITSLESYALARKNSIVINYGVLGENILIDINPYHLLPGERIYIGESVLEITQNCTLCKGLSSVNPKLPKLLKTDRGIFAKVLQGSKISLNDTVSF